jgi:hypothetical protein
VRMPNSPLIPMREDLCFDKHRQQHHARSTRTSEGSQSPHLRGVTCSHAICDMQLSGARAGETRHSHKKLIAACVEEYVKRLAAAADNQRLAAAAGRQRAAASPSPSSTGVAGTGSAADPLCLDNDDAAQEGEVVEVVCGRQPHPSSSQRRCLGSVDLTKPEAAPLSMLERLQQQSTSPIVAKRDLKRAGCAGGEPTPKRPPPALSAEEAFMQFDETVSSEPMSWRGAVFPDRDESPPPAELRPMLACGASPGESPTW